MTKETKTRIEAVTMDETKEKTKEGTKEKMINTRARKDQGDLGVLIDGRRVMMKEKGEIDENLRLGRNSREESGIVMIIEMTITASIHAETFFAIALRVARKTIILMMGMDGHRFLIGVSVVTIVNSNG